MARNLHRRIAKRREEEKETGREKTREERGEAVTKEERDAQSVSPSGGQPPTFIPAWYSRTFFRANTCM